MKIAYIVSRFPLASETFILREMAGVDGQDGLEIELLSLFPPARPFVHPLAERWMGRVRTPSMGNAVRACAWWLVRRPATLLRSTLALAWAYRRRPDMLVRALATLGLAAAHARELEGSEVEHLHAHFATYPAITAWVCRRLTGVGYSFTAHAHDIFVDQSFLATLVAEARFVATISEFNCAFLAPYAAGSATPIHLVRCGIEPDAYRYRARALPVEGPIEALCIASFEEYKGHRVLLEALAGSGDLQRVRLRLVGGGRLEGAIRAQISQLGLDDRVELLGQRTEAEVAALFDEADVFLLASIVAADGQMEGIPVALMESLACGVPALASRLSGIPELIQDARTGVLAEPGDVADLRRAFLRLLADGDQTCAWAAAGRALVESDFNVARSAQRMRELFLAVTDR